MERAGLVGATEAECAGAETAAVEEAQAELSAARDQVRSLELKGKQQAERESELPASYRIPGAAQTSPKVAVVGLQCQHGVPCQVDGQSLCVAILDEIDCQLLCFRRPPPGRHLHDRRGAPKSQICQKATPGR